MSERSIPAVSRIILSVALLFTGVTGTAGAGGLFASAETEPEPIDPPAAYRWYSVVSGIPAPLDPGLLTHGAETREPWTVRPRVSAIVQHDGGIYLGINGYGVVLLDPASPESVPARALIDPALFGGRVLERIFTFDGRLFCHLYRNTAFDTDPPEGPPAALLEIVTGADGLSASPFPLPFQAEHPDWEAVELLPAAGGDWYASWKRSGETVEFAYVRFPFPGGRELDVTREEVVKAYGYADIRQAPIPVWELFTEIADRSGGETVVHLTVSSPDITSPDRFRAGSRTSLERGRAELRAVNLYEAGGVYALLTADGRVLFHDTDGSTSRLTLPSLPRGYVYTEVWTDGSSLIAGWEEQDFLYVGAAGFVVAPRFR